MIPRLVALLSALAWPAVSVAQRVQPELRVDAIGPAPHAVHAGAGLTVALGHYARISAVGGIGVRHGDIAGRGDLIARVLLDPFRQRRFGFSLGGGLSVRERPWLLAVVELEGPERFGWMPAVQGGLGGGPRVGLVFRRARPGRR